MDTGVIIFITALCVLIVGLIVFAFVSSYFKKRKVIENCKREGTMGQEDIGLAGTFRMTAGQAAKEVAKTVAIGVVGAFFGVGGVSMQPKQIVMALGRQNIQIFMEKDGAFVKSFKNSITLTKDMIQNIIIDRESKNNLALSIVLNDGQKIMLYVHPLYKTDSVEQVKAILQSYNVA